MTPVDPKVRQRIVWGAADMLRRRGLNATSVRELAKHAGTPLGSTYHYFPGGKQELVIDAVRLTGGAVAESLRASLAAGPEAGLATFLALWREILVGTVYQAGCPVLAVCVENPPDTDGHAPGRNDPIRAAASGVFVQWRALLADSLRQHGAAPSEAEGLATTIIAAVEGAIVLCRAEQSIEPFDQVCTQLHAMIDPGHRHPFPG